eukprot:SAG22_NODE_9500_length_586_cov_1.404517_1_plen_186_part_10
MTDKLAFFDQADGGQPVPPGVLNVCAKAGDVVVISERVLHGALRWQPKDRERRFLTCRCAFLSPLPATHAPPPHHTHTRTRTRMSIRALPSRRCAFWPASPPGTHVRSVTPAVSRATRRYNVQHNLTGNPDSAPFSDAILSRLSPETIELASYAPCAQACRAFSSPPFDHSTLTKQGWIHMNSPDS